jgi:N,N'-diacetyllegionaminate synthase
VILDLKIKIAKKWIGENLPTFIMAEAGINHNGSLKTAKKMIFEAKKAGADAIKFQTFKAVDLATPNSKFFKTFQNLEFTDNDFRELSDYAKQQNIIFCSTPFSEKAVNILSKLKVPAFKIASGDLTHIPLIKYASKKNKPMIISTGMANIDELKIAIKAIESTKNKKIIVMHSVSSYPTPTNEVNLNVIQNLKKDFRYPIGFSDNGPGILVPQIAVAAGAKIIEKHFTLDKKMKGPDQKMSADPKELQQIISKIREIEELLGDEIKKCQPSELENRVNARRSLTTNQVINKNERIVKTMLQIIRPGSGIQPKYLSKVIGMRPKKKLSNYESLKWNNLSSD